MFWEGGIILSLWLNFATGTFSCFQRCSWHPRQSCCCFVPQGPPVISCRCGSIPSLFSLPHSQKPILWTYIPAQFPVFLDTRITSWCVFLKCVFLEKGIGCFFHLACVSTPVGAKVLESATVMFKSCFGDYYINKIALKESSHLSLTQAPQL